MTRGTITGKYAFETTVKSMPMPMLLLLAAALDMIW